MTAIRPGAHYDLLHRGRLVQTSFHGGDCERRIHDGAQLGPGRRQGRVLHPEPSLAVPDLPTVLALGLEAGIATHDAVEAAARWAKASAEGLLRTVWAIRGGAEIFPDEGLDLLLNQQPRNTQAIVDPTFLGLFTSQTSSTVPARSAVLSTQTGVTEVANSGAYARVSTDNTDWGTPATNGDGRRSTAAQKSFPESTGSWGTVNGFFDATVATHGGGVAFFYANFDDEQPVVVNAAGYTIRVTPYWQIDG